MLKYILAGYLVLVNAAAFLLMLVDKIKAKRSARRIRERTLILSGVLGGCIGALCGMYLFRHKTQHPTFTLGIPVILAVQIVLTVLLYSWLH